jgi:serine/threonine protein kinase
MEKCNGGSLRDFLEKTELECNFTEEVSKAIIAKILQGLVFLELSKITH